MKLIKKAIVTVLLLAFMVTASGLPLLGNTTVAQAAAVTISSKTLNLKVGQSETLTIKGNKKKATWSSSKKNVAVVSRKGKVTAKAAGKATITASVAGKKLTCSVTVTKANPNPYLKDAPFKAKEVTFRNMSFVIPSEWKCDQEATDTKLFLAMLNPNDALQGSAIAVDVEYKSPAIDYDTLKEAISTTYNSDFFQNQLKNYLDGLDYQVTDFKQDEIDTNLGKALKTEFTVKCGIYSLKEYVYNFVIDNYVVEIATTALGDQDLASVTEYIVNSVVVE